MRMPDCRSKYVLDACGNATKQENEYYEGNLNDHDKELLKKWDYAVDSMSNFFDNLDIYDFDIPGEDINIARFLDNHPKILNAMKEAFAAYAEMERNENIVPMIETSEDN